MTRTSDTILTDTARAFNVTLDRMFSYDRTEPVCLARFAAMKIIRDQRNLSLPVIARLVRRKHHTTVLGGIRRADKLLVSDPGFRDAFMRAQAPYSVDSSGRCA